MFFVSFVSFFFLYLFTFLISKNTEVNSTYAIFLERCGQVEEAEDIYLKIFEVLFFFFLKKNELELFFFFSFLMFFFYSQGQKESAFALISYGNFLLRKGQILPANILFANAMNHCQNSNVIFRFSKRKRRGEKKRRKKREKEKKLLIILI